MKRQHITILLFAACIFIVVTVVLAAQSQDRFTLKAANGIAFSEFRDYEAWQLIATSQPDDAGGCGTSKVGCTKAILGNPTMIQAYRVGIPANGQAVPDGAAMAKIEWMKDHNDVPYGVTVPATQTEVSFMMKDSKRFPDTNGWGYATFEYDAPSGTFKPSKPTTAANARSLCHGCHVAGAKARDFVYTEYAKR
jgi:Cytochrome P460